MNAPDITDWIGRSREDRDVLRPAVAEAFTATIASTRLSCTVAPLLAHWLCFQEIALQSELGEDGHPRLGGFLPPVTLPRRMWAAGKVDWLRPIAVGADLVRRSTIADVKAKSGRSGDLVFVTVGHEISDETGPLLRERQDIVYREPSTGAAPPAQPGMTDAAWSAEVAPDPLLLFRYSAMTGNTHRIHYDRDYATQVEGYPALVVHGPLIATFLLNAFVSRNPDAQVATFSFRAVRPLFDTAPFTLRGSPTDAASVTRLQAVDADGALCMDATVTLA